MAGVSAELEPWQRQRVQDWFDEKAAGGVVGKCPMCGTRSWTLNDQMVHAPTWVPDGGMILGGVQIPLIMLACRHCGNAQFHSAVMIGLLDKENNALRTGVEATDAGA